ncbi:MAG: hypothetical protein P4L76_05290 [Beijerinckiaceae bacterium]|nr:hypothetical protein [Beijerinckiaceae bacterium]
MGRNFIRTCSLQVGGAGRAMDLSNLRVVFKIEASLIQSPNMAHFRVYNVAPTTEAALMQGEFTNVQFSGGYVENSGLLYTGDIKQVIKGHETAVDSYVDIFCGDGDKIYNFSVITKTLAAGWTPRDKFDAALSAMGLKPGIINVDLSQPKFPRGIPLAGLARDALREIANSKNATWSIRDGATVDMIDHSKPYPSSTVLMNAQTGMVGWPRQTANGIIVTSFINPDLKQGTLIQINNKSILQAQRDNTPTGAASQLNQDLDYTGKIAADGIYSVLLLERSGDTRGQDWYDTATCIAAADGTANEMEINTYVTP